MHAEEVHHSKRGGKFATISTVTSMEARHKLFSCSTQLSMEFFLLINVIMPTIVGILTFMSRINYFLGLSEPEKCCIS